MRRSCRRRGRLIHGLCALAFAIALLTAGGGCRTLPSVAPRDCSAALARSGAECPPSDLEPGAAAGTLSPLNLVFEGGGAAGLRARLESPASECSQRLHRDDPRLGD